MTATDPNLADNAKLTYSIIEEANATSLFAIDPTSGALSFMTAPTYDSNTPANNTYVVEVAVGDQDGAYDFQFITITVTPASQLAPPSAADVPTGPGQTTDDPTNAATDNPAPLSSRGAVYNRTVADTNTSNGPIDIVNVVADASPNINIVLGAGSVLSAGTGDVVIDIESDNIAQATGGGLSGIPPMVAVVNAHATVGGTINVSLAGTIQHQGNLTLQLHTVNEADATGEALSVGPVGGNGVTTDAEVTPTISTFVAPSSNINVTGDFTIRTISESTASASLGGDRGRGRARRRRLARQRRGRTHRQHLHRQRCPDHGRRRDQRRDVPERGRQRQLDRQRRNGHSRGLRRLAARHRHRRRRPPTTPRTCRPTWTRGRS